MKYKNHFFSGTGNEKGLIFFLHIEQRIDAHL